MIVRNALLIAGLVLVVFGCAPAPAPEEKASTPADPAPIDAVRDKYAAIYNSGDVTGLADLYTDDAVVMNNHAAAVSGKQAILQDAQAMVDQFTVNFSITPVDTQIVNDLAYEHGTATVSLTPKAGGDPIQQTGSYLVILKRGADGAWRVHREIGNSNQPMPAP
jgi:uncharacterized protein (TIGR02246 family)